MSPKNVFRPSRSKVNEQHSRNAAYQISSKRQRAEKIGGREANHSLPSGVEVKNTWSYKSTPQYDTSSWRGV
jgi:hypothetical protein